VAPDKQNSPVLKALQRESAERNLMTDYNSNDFAGATQFAAEGSSENTSKIELSPFWKGLATATGIGLTVTAIGVGAYWANKGLKATADNIGVAADGIRAAHAFHEQL